MHAEETVQVLSSDRAWVRFGSAKDDLPNKIMLKKNMTLHIPEAEWHVFGYEEGGSGDPVHLRQQGCTIKYSFIEGLENLPRHFKP